MQPEVFAPLAAGEESMRIQIDASEWMATMSPAEVRVAALQAFLAYAQKVDYVVTRGPEISVIRYPRNPGEPGVVVALGVGHPMVQ